MPKVSILVPVYNEERLAADVLGRVMAAPLPPGWTREIVIVDDASTDNTPAVLAAFTAAHPDHARLFTQEKNRGKGAALRRAIEAMAGDVGLFQDADLEYDPGDYQKILELFDRTDADAVYGSRYAARPARRVGPAWHRWGNAFLTFFSNLATGLDLTDMETCYKAVRADLLRSLRLTSNRFGIEPEITARLAAKRAVVYEVPVSYRGRGYAEGKKIGWRDGFNALWVIFRCWIRKK